MGYRCYVTGEHVQGKSPIMVATEQRKVEYNNYAVSMRGKNLFKQYTGTTEGFETVKEVAISPDNYGDFITTFKPRIVGVKKIINETESYSIKYEDKHNAIANNRIVVNDNIIEKKKTQFDALSEYNWQQDD